MKPAVLNGRFGYAPRRSLGRRRNEMKPAVLNGDFGYAPRRSLGRRFEQSEKRQS